MIAVISLPKPAAYYLALGIRITPFIMMHAFDEAATRPNPIEQFGVWFRSALDNSPEDWFDPSAMTLATSSKDGCVTARIVLLEQLGEEGFTFYTHYASRKGKQLSENPRAALVFHWPHVQRQVRIEGNVQKVSRPESDAYFRSRPRPSQLAAAVSSQSEIIPSRAFVEQQFERLQEALAGNGVPLPENWGGYRLVPEAIEFWQQRENRLHDRIRYRKNENGQWVMERLAP